MGGLDLKVAVLSDSRVVLWWTFTQMPALGRHQEHSDCLHFMYDVLLYVHEKFTS